MNLSFTMKFLLSAISLGLLAASAPVAAASSPRPPTYGFEGRHPITAYVPMASGASKTGKIHERWDLSKMKDRPIWMFHGELDTVVPYGHAKESAELMAKLNPRFKFTTFPGVDHGSMKHVFAVDEMYRWLLDQSLNQR